LELTDFRNLSHLVFEPLPGALTVVRGENGAGKTSLLEAIVYASTGRSFRVAGREALVRNGARRAVVRVDLDAHGRRVLTEIELAPPRRDRVLVNRQPLRRSGELLETLRVTIFTPDDLALVKGGPGGRRDLLDDVLESCDTRLAATRQTVERVLRQRNTLLRQAGGRATPDVLATLDVWDAQLAKAGGALVAAREELVSSLRPAVREAFSGLTGLGADLQLSYQRSFDGELAEALARSRSEDVRRGVTGVGPQRDELAVDLDDLDARTRLSQGRQRAVALALRLGAHRVVEQLTGSRPVLLLDDAFSELDEATAAALSEQLPGGQAVLTTAGPLLAQLDTARVVSLSAGRLG
jgi:DNA replication and repair protein RecF